MMKPKVKTIFSNREIIHTTCTCFSRDQTKLCFGGNENDEVTLVDLQSETKKSFSSGHVSISGSDFSADGLLATVGRKDFIHIWNVSGTEILKSTKLEPSFAEDYLYGQYVKFFPRDSNLLVSGGCHVRTKVWNIERKKVISKFKYISSGVCARCVEVLPDEQTIITGGGDRKIRIWDLRIKKYIQTLEHDKAWKEGCRHGRLVTSVSYNPNTYSLASGGNNARIKIFDFRTFRLVQEYIRENLVHSVCFHPSGKYLISGLGVILSEEDDKPIVIFDISEKRELFSLNEHHADVGNVQFTPDGKFFSSASYDRVILWDFPLGENWNECRFKDSDEDERVKYLIKKDLVKEEENEIDEKQSFCEPNVLKIRIDNFISLFSYKIFFAL